MNTDYKLSLQTEQVIGTAKQLAAHSGHSVMDTGHLLMAILNNADSKAYIIMESMGIHLYEVENEYKKINPSLGRFVDSVSMDSEIKKAFDEISQKKESSQDKIISPEDLFEAVFTNSESKAVKIIENLGFPTETILSEMHGT
jgi:ATP-dependent Clp protease ATP-binding subunit ClpA